MTKKLWKLDYTHVNSDGTVNFDMSAEDGSHMTLFNCYPIAFDDHQSDGYPFTDVTFKYQFDNADES